MEKQLVRLAAVLLHTGQSRAAWYAAVKAGLAPAPVKINGGRAAAWVASEVDDYIDRQISARDAAQQLLTPAANKPEPMKSTESLPLPHAQRGRGP